MDSLEIINNTISMNKILVLLLLVLFIPLYDTPVTSAEQDKVIYLTFDDGPSCNTIEILDILKKYNIKATFFVVRREGYNSVYKRIIREGHTLGGHSSTHKYSEIYKSVDSYYNDLNDLNDYIYTITGFSFNLIRFPGGSNNTISHRYCNNIMPDITARAYDLGYIYYDWNVDSGDSAKSMLDTQVIAQNVIKQCLKHNSNIVLLHDAPNMLTTPDALPIIINTLSQHGYRFSRITNDTEVVRFI